MVRLKDLLPEFADNLRGLAIQEYGPAPWVPAPDLKDARVAIISTAGIHRASDVKFAGGATDYRLLPGDLDYSDLAMSHVSVNYDRSGYQQDPNVVFPLELLRQLAANGEIDSVANWHYSFMGATEPTRMTETAQQVARMMKEDGVNAAILIPV
jgi:D-proline reductase (dithiol) PrdB